MEESANIQGLDDQLAMLKEKRKKLEEITSKLQELKHQNEEIQKEEQKHQNEEIKKEEQKTSHESIIESSKNNETKSEKPTTKTKKNTDFDQDRLALSKQEILDFCERILEKWKTDPSKNAKHIFAMNAVKTSVLWTDEETLKEIWTEILRWAFDLLYRNAIAQAKEENLEWSQIMEKLGKS